jgi:extracellular factor (EF) 3-hydroxypalmitic acid methyl ester biosynthesis protein
MSLAHCPDSHECDHCQLDSFHRTLSEGDAYDGMDELVGWLTSKRLAERDDSWSSWVQTTALRHPIQRLLHQDPLTLRAFQKPRGYAGDAPTLDFMYAAWFPEFASLAPSFYAPAVAGVHRYTTTGRASRAVSDRCRFCADAIDELGRKGKGGRVLSVTAGHLREALLSKAVREGTIDEVVALDQDAESIAEISSACKGLKVTPYAASIRRLLAGQVDLGLFDLVYAAGLFDYLAPRAATALLEHLVAMLRPAGRVLVANFVPGHADVGYLESYMAWHLIYRTESDLIDLVAASPRLTDTTTHRAWRDDTGSIAYLELVRG